MPKLISSHSTILIIFTILFSSVIAATVSSFHSYALTVGQDTQINASVCSGPPKVFSSQIVSPSDGAVVANQPSSVTISAAWLESIEVLRGSTVLSKTSYPGNPASTVALSIPLVEGGNNLTFNISGGCPAVVQSHVSNITFDPQATTVNPTTSNSRSPRLTGAVASSSYRVYVWVLGVRYTAINNGDGTWTLPAGTIEPGLADGRYDIRVVTELPDGSQQDDQVFSNALAIDTVKPTGSLKTLQSTERSPRLNGTVSDNTSIGRLTINGSSYTAINNGDGTWVIPGGLITPLASGAYAVTLTITDLAGNQTVINSSLTIRAEGEIGFILPPNTGYLRLGTVNIASKYMYISVFAVTISAIISVVIFERRKLLKNK